MSIKSVSSQISNCSDNSLTRSIIVKPKQVKEVEMTLPTKDTETGTGVTEIVNTQPNETEIINDYLTENKKTEVTSDYVSNTQRKVIRSHKKEDKFTISDDQLLREEINLLKQKLEKESNEKRQLLLEQEDLKQK